MSHHYAKFKENPCVGTDASTPLFFDIKNHIGASVFLLLKKIVCTNFSLQIFEIISNYRKIGYKINVLQTDCMLGWLIQSRLATLLS